MQNCNYTFTIWGKTAKITFPRLLRWIHQSTFIYEARFIQEAAQGFFTRFKKNERGVGWTEERGVVGQRSWSVCWSVNWSYLPLWTVRESRVCVSVVSIAHYILWWYLFVVVVVVAIVDNTSSRSSSSTCTQCSYDRHESTKVSSVSVRRMCMCSPALSVHIVVIGCCLLLS